MKHGLLFTLMFPPVFLGAMPTSSNYQLHNYNYGSGGTNSSSSSSYLLNATTGQTGTNSSGSTNFQSKPGNVNAQQAYVPVAPTFTNPSNYYNKLHFVINPGTSPSDTKFSIAISTDGFATTNYVKSDNTIGTTRTISDYQTYAAWGSGTGQDVIGLTPSTSYQIKVNAFQGNFTETQYGPTATAATVAVSITFDIDVSASDTETAAPYATSFGNLLPAIVTNSAAKIWVDIDTNAASGAMVYMNSSNNGLKSNTTGYTIASATADLSSASTGFGLQASTATQSSGGPLTISSPYNGVGQNVGLLDTALRQVFSATAPITAGRGSVVLKAKTAANTPSGADYQDVLTIIVAGSF